MEEICNSSIPSWLNDGFLKMIVSTEDSNVDIISTKIECECESEENRRYTLYRVCIELTRDGHEENNSLIVKAAEGNPGINRSEKSLTKEINAYTILNLRMHKILEKLHQKFAPKLYYAHNCPNEVLVHEDLDASDFRHAMPTLGYDTKTCVSVIRKLAHYHASSVVLHKKHPDAMASFKISTYSDREMLEKKFPPVLKKLAKEVERWPDYKERFAVKLHNLANSAVDKICECVKTRESDFNVLCHEELCLQNIMFEYSENSLDINDVRFLDYKSVHWGSPAIDFHRFLHSCAAPEVLEWSHILVEEYYCVLEETLKRLGYPELCPSIAHFYRQLEKRVMFGLILGLVDRAILLADSDSTSNYKDTKDTLDIEFSDRYKNLLKKILIVLQIKGWL